MRTYKPDQTLNAANSKLAGVSIDSQGHIREIRVKFVAATPEAPKIIVASKELLNSMYAQLQRLGL